MAAMATGSGGAAEMALSILAAADFNPYPTRTLPKMCVP